MAAAKVRIFELAKELGLSSKETIGLFEQLGLEAKNQLSVVDDGIADLVRGVLLGGKGNARSAAPKAASAAPVAPAAPPAATAPVQAAATNGAAAEAPPRRPVAPAAAPESPIPTLRPVTTPQRPRVQRPAAGSPPAANAPVDGASPASNGSAGGAAASGASAPAAAAVAALNGAVASAPDAPAPASVDTQAESVPLAAAAPEAPAAAVTSAAPAASVQAPQAAAELPVAETPDPVAAAAAPASTVSDGAAPVADGATATPDAPKAPVRPSSPAPRLAPPRPGSPAPRLASPAPRIATPGPRIAPGVPRPIAGPMPSRVPQNTPMPPRPRPPVAADDSPIPTLRPVPSGRSSIAEPRAVAPAPEDVEGDQTGIAASADPGPASGLPGRPGVAPRPGQAGVGQGYRGPQPLARPGVAPAPGTPVPSRRPAGNGAFRALTPPGGVAGGPRPFVPRTPTPGAPASPGGGPSPSSGSGGPRGPQGRGRGYDPAAKKDREKEMLLEKERQRKKRSGVVDAPVGANGALLETIEIPDVLTVQELATSMIVPAKDVIKELIKMGTMATINQNIPAETAQQVARKFGFNATIKEAGEEVVVEQEEDRPELLTTRPPVVTVMGHVDHGKTSLLDRIRSANVASGEAGGITQRIGAYTVEKDGRAITFIDTPGHEAFTAMRARGGKVADVAILVVAADDGVMPQTIEAISHIRAANVPIVVAINKMDREDAQPDRVKSQLAEQGLQPVDWGGKIEMVPVSARSGDNIDALLETVLLEADIKDLKANKTRRAQGLVIESALDKGRGAVATVLVQNGTLRVGDVVVVGGAFGKIRALVDDKGKQVKKAGPSIPVEIMGLSEVPSAGDSLMVVSDERVAREAAAKRASRRQEVRIAASSGPRISLESFMAMSSDGQKTLNLILKADGQGAVAALRGRVEGLSNSQVDIRVIYAGVGAITPNDVNLAAASNAVLIGFNIRPDETVKRLADNDQVDLRFYSVIYEVENDLKKAMVGMLAPKFREVILGRAEVREVFKVSKVGTIAGCYVQSGKLQRNAKVRILRDNAMIYESELESLRRFKDDVKEVADGYECGVQVAKFADLKTGDVIEAYTSELVAPELAAV